MSSRELDRAAKFLVIALSAGACAVLAFVVASRITHPVALEVMEEGMAAQVLRVRSGQPLYAEPTLEHVAYVYGPAFHWLGALLFGWFGESLAVLRALSVAGTVAVALCIATVTRGVSGGVAATLAVGLFAACYPAGAAWFDLARVDMVALALLLPVPALVGGSRGACVAAVALTLASFLVKQSSAPLALACLLGLGWGGRMRIVVVGAAFVGACAAAAVVLHVTSVGWSTFFLFDLPSQHEFRAEYWPDALVGQIVERIPALVVLAAFGAFVVWRECPRLRPLVVFAGVALASGVVQRVRHGGWYNAMIPAHAALAVLAAIAFAAAMQRGGRTLLAAIALVVAQFVLLAEDPRQHVPDARARANAEALFADLRAVDGEVLAPSHVFALHLAGKPLHADGTALWDLARATSPRAAALRSAVAAQLHDALRRGRFAALLITDEFATDLAGGRAATLEPAFPPGEHMHTRTPGGFESLWWLRMK